MSDFNPQDFITKATVIGIEKYPEAGSPYLKCDACGATLGSEQVIKHRNPHWGDARILAEEARKLGWTGTLSRGSRADDDRCTACSSTPLDGAAEPD